MLLILRLFHLFYQNALLSFHSHFFSLSFSLLFLLSLESEFSPVTLDDSSASGVETTSRSVVSPLSFINHFPNFASIIFFLNYCSDFFFKEYFLSIYLLIYLLRGDFCLST